MPWCPARAEAEQFLGKPNDMLWSRVRPLIRMKHILTAAAIVIKPIPYSILICLA